MIVTKKGLVLRVRLGGEKGKYIDILTDNKGIIEVFVRCSKKINGKHIAATQLFAYSNFCLTEKEKRYYLESAEPIHIFYNLRNSISKLALASYFLDLIYYTVPKDNLQQNEILRLILNTLYYLTEDTRDEAFLKSIFELRLMSELGMMPDVIMCPICYEHTPKELVFSVNRGKFYCKNCYESIENDFSFFMPVGGLMAIRHIILTDFSRMFQFKISNKIQNILSAFTEEFVHYNLDYIPKTLIYYKNIIKKI